MINVTDRTFKINNTWLGFHMTFFTILRKNLYSEHVLDMLLHHYATKAVEGNDTRPSTGVGKVELARHYVKIIYIGYFSGVAHRRVCKPSTDFCKLIVIKFVYSIFRRQASYAHRLQIFLCKL